MDIHPIVVHFPIALLTVYTLFEVARFPALVRQEWYLPVKAVLLLIGVAGSVAALQTGEVAEQAFIGTPTMRIVEMHAFFANLTTYVYVLLAVVYAVQWAEQAGGERRVPPFAQWPWSVLRAIARVFGRTGMLVLLSVVGCALLTITGALGGAMVYGPEVDPIVSFVYHMLFAQ